MIIVHYEVYVLEGRGWMLHARFPRSERETAVNEAKELEHQLRIKVKVVRETYYTDTNAFDEAEVYITGMKAGEAPRAAAARSAAPEGARAGGGGAAAAKPAGKAASPPAPAPARKAPARPPPKPHRNPLEVAQARQVMVRLTGITALALTVAIVAIKVTPEFIVLAWKMGFPIRVSPDGYNQMLFAVFALTFLMTAVPLGMKFLPRQGAATARTAPAADPDLGWGRRAAAPPPPRRTRRAASDDGDSLPLLDDLPAFPDDTDSEPPPPALEVLATASAAAEAAGPATAEGEVPTVMRFLDGAVDFAKGAGIAMDAYNKFALHLYLAGAVESLCEFRKLGSSAKAKLIANALETLGVSGELARSFYDKLPEYLREPRYLGAVTAGRGAMSNLMLGDEMGAHLVLRDVFANWNKKNEKKAQLMTVLFTDMVGSTDMTQDRGDAAAQEIVRRHNLIVRAALQKYGGTEVKHTGDGIMASFYSAGGAIDAMITVQRQVAEHNARKPDQELHLRIGLNAGEPIQEEDDLFGSTVQLAARVCAATGTDQIFCTAGVKESSGKPANQFRDVGAKPMKGFKQPIPLYEIRWQ
ncbi:adenylate/guanylate cyclase domain-containing protein [Magnetospirillum sp. UT-4]|uniref:adenylate/guanylate cyclase domain-containing protein n=1 Tax=Magnetospirillum sp. UT-4 TaxID=2681467 RepID=UPI001381796B|nr:adenylate/guanylate cyclase domain-containing protein [Magnetospirillum sp. UT-4]CAA7625593.1 putative Adenylate/guanylate cyclase [Magnetospirillum sp. UT-4]